MDVPLLERMSQGLAHRGPDDFAFAFVGRNSFHQWKEAPPNLEPAPGAGLAHRRLSIIDTSEAGRQPFVSPDGRYWLVYNGEIYNYRELRDLLRQQGVEFRTETDTEVVLQAFARWGVACFEKFNGMWALVLYDAETGRTLASRDRFGVKPLYYTKAGDDWLFCSEIRPLFLHEKVSKAPNLQVAHSYLYDLSGPRGDETFFDGIRTLEPGCWAVVENGSLKIERYWHMPTEGSSGLCSEAEAVESVREIFSDSVRMRLRSDVRVGVMVSGGLDSTSVISHTAEQMRNDPATRKIIGDVLLGFFARFPDHELDESENVDAIRTFADVAVQMVYPLKQGGIPALHDDAIQSMERPFFNSVPLVHTLLMRCARDNGAKVILNGHGADELFGGYPFKYDRLAAIDALHRGELLNAALDFAAAVRNGDAFWRRGLHKMLNRALPNGGRGNKAGKTKKGFLRRPESGTPLQYLPRGNSGSMLNERLRYDFQHQILPHWLHLEDRISMSCSIESRQPFLDYRLVELAFALEGGLKVRRGTTKYILRKAMAPRLPKKIVADRLKMRFPGPDGNWLRGPLRETMTAYLIDQTPRVEPFVDVAALRSFVKTFLEDERTPATVLWRVLDTELWMRRFFR